MLKPRNVVITLVLNYLLIMIVSIFMEAGAVQDRAREANSLIRIAADMALQNMLVVDNYFTRESNMGDEFVMMTDMGGAFFEEVNPYFRVYNTDSKEGAFAAAFGNNSAFQTVAQESGDIKTPMYYYDGWYQVPSILQMGQDAFGSAWNFLWDKSTVDAGEKRDQFIIDYRYDISMQNSDIVQRDGTTEKAYFFTPLSLGVTYIDEKMLNFYFANNMDLLLRAKYNDTTYSESPAQWSERNRDYGAGAMGIMGSGRGLANNPFWDNNQVGYNFDREMERVVNNGRLSYLRGAWDDSAGEWDNGHPAVVSYKLIDVNDAANDEILKLIFGAIGGDGSNGPKGDYLKSQSTTASVAGMVGYDQSFPMLIARVTFAAELFIPYDTMVVRGWRQTELDGALIGANYTNMRNITGTDGAEGGILYEYTTYFAVLP